MNALSNIWHGLNWSYLTDMIISVIPAFICITLHELSHGYAAYRLGDNTAKERGRLTLNPIKHIDIFGLVMMIAFKFGWAKPVPVNMYNFKNPKSGMAITALAGPVSNVIIACIAMFLYGLLYTPLYRAGTALSLGVLTTVATTAQLSMALAIFNIIPIPPLDGSKVLFSVLSEENYFKLMQYERYGMILLMLVVATGLLRTPLSIVLNFLMDRIFIFARWGDALMGMFI